MPADGAVAALTPVPFPSSSTPARWPSRSPQACPPSPTAAAEPTRPPALPTTRDELEHSPIRRGEGPDVADLDELPFDDDIEDEEDSADLERGAAENGYVLHRRASTQSRDSVHSRLLLRRDSTMTEASAYAAGRSSQKIYMANEDLYIVVAGFRTSTAGLAAYIFICLATFGLGWLLFRWRPRWHVRIAGEAVRAERLHLGRRREPVGRDGHPRRRQQAVRPLALHRLRRPQQAVGLPARRRPRPPSSTTSARSTTATSASSSTP